MAEQQTHIRAPIPNDISRLGLLDLTENGSIVKSEEIFVTNEAPQIKRVSFYKDKTDEKNDKSFRIHPILMGEHEKNSNETMDANLFNGNIDSPNIRKRRDKSLTPAETLKNYRKWNFFLILHILIKAINNLRFRTSFRPLKCNYEEGLKLLNDFSYYPDKKQKDLSLKKYVERNTVKKKYYEMMVLLTNVKIFTILSENLQHLFKVINNLIPVIKPNQRVKIVWDVFILIIISFFFFVIPLQISFDIYYDEQFTLLMESAHVSSTVTNFFLVIPEVIMIADTVLKFITGYYEQGVIIMDKEKIIKKYLKKGLLYDILSYFPILMQAFYKDSVFKANGDLGLILKSLQLLVFCKLKRINALLRNFEDVIMGNGKNDYLLSLVRISFRIFFVAHTNACIWHACAYYNSSASSTWLDYGHLKDSPWTERYWNAMYWAVSSMVTTGFGEKVSPQNNTELVVGVGILFISAFMFGFTLNSMGQIVESMSKNENEFKETISIINQFMKKKSIDFELQGRVRKYLEYTMDKERNSDKEMEILNKLTASLRNEVLLQSHGNILTQIPFFTRNFSAQTVQTLAFSMKKVKYSPEEYIYKENDIDDFSLFIVEKGECEENISVCSQDKTIKTKKVLRSFKRGEIFGLRSFITSEKRELSAMSRNFSTVLEIKKSDFLEVLQRSKRDYENYCQIRQEMQMKANKLQAIRCESCSKPHFLIDCPILHYIPNKSFILSRNCYSREQDRVSRERKAHKSLHALKAQSLIKDKAKAYETVISSDSESFESSFSEESEEEGEETHEKSENFKEFQINIVEKERKVLEMRESLRNLQPILESEEQLASISESEEKKAEEKPAESNHSLKSRKSAMLNSMQQSSLQKIKEKTHKNSQISDFSNENSLLKSDNFQSIRQRTKKSLKMPTLSVFDENQGITTYGNGTNASQPKEILQNSVVNPGVMRKSKQFSSENPKKFSFMVESIAKNSEFLASGLPNVETAGKYQSFIRQSQSAQGEVAVFSENKIPNELYYFDMDAVGVTTTFYPHNNVENVLKTVSSRVRKKSKRKTLKLLKN